MDNRNDEDIVERALLRLLCPAQGHAIDQPDSAYRKKIRRHKTLAAIRTHQAEWIPQPARIFVHEVLTAHTLSVCWSDSQTGFYAEQIWRLGLARHDGYCALSGRPIGQGDEVYRPLRSATCVPANWNRMILATAVSLGQQYAKPAATQYPDRAEALAFA